MNVKNLILILNYLVMEKKVMHFYRPLKNGLSELCFNIKTSQFLSDKELKTLVWVLSETFEPWKFGLESFLPDKKKVTEVGPRLNVATPFNTLKF